MDHDLQSRLLYELKNLEKERDECASRLLLLDNVKADKLKMCVQEKKRPYYYLKHKEESKYRFIGPGNDSRVLRIQEEAHVQESLFRIDNNISLIKALLDGYKPYDYSSVDMDLPMAYRSAAVISSDYQVVGKRWKEEKLRFQAHFPENYPEKKKETTSDGTKVKTISEVVLYEKILSAGLISVYELPLVSADYGPNLYPDFTVLSPLDLKTEIIIEYVGRLDQQQYRDDFARRINRYMRNGYIPGVNLFFAFSDLNGHIDSLQISRILADIMGIR